MGADGPGKAEIAKEELARVRAFGDDWEQSDRSLTGKGLLVVDDWEQASTVENTQIADQITRHDVLMLGDILLGNVPGRESDRDITLFDSTGLAIQDLAIALAALWKYEGGELQDVQTLEL